MMKAIKQKPRCAKLSSSVLRYSTVVLLGAAMIAAQGKANKPSAQTNSNRPGKRPHVATLRSSDSPEGSRVALSSDRSLADYEAYRRGDRFYVKIPAAEVPRADTLRGRGFADVKAQRSGESTVVSFRLQPGATARVEQRSNRLDVVITVPGGSSSLTPNPGRELSGSTPRPGSNRNSNANKRNISAAATNGNSNSSGPRKTANSTVSNSNTANKANQNSAAAAPSSQAAVKIAPTPAAMPSQAPRLPSPTPAPRSSPVAAPVTANQPATSPNPPRQDRWSQIRERADYWVLLAQLNPIPVAIGVGLLLLFLILFLFHRRRTKSPRRPRPLKESVKTAKAAPAPEPKSEPIIAPVAAAVAAPLVTMSSGPEETGKSVSALASAPPAEPSAPVDPRRAQVTQVTEAAASLMRGGIYDQSIIGSADPETRKLVGAELLSAMVGRNAQRRQYAREAFIKHGYFDDATRDLRLAESPNERAAAARRLSFAGDREATPHLIEALEDTAPDVRRTAVEALMDLRDPAAIGPLNTLMQTESDRRVPRTLIKHAIDACATAPAPAAVDSPLTLPDPSAQRLETEREVIEL